jgi:hypothetical protein
MRLIRFAALATVVVLAGCADTPSGGREPFHCEGEPRVLGG